jgi:hypothetical protein
MLRAQIIAVAAIALAVAGCPPEPKSPLPPNPNAGAQPPASGPRWQPKGFTRETEGCNQTWACDCSTVPVRAGCHAEPAPDAITQGACAADSGPLNGCNRCMALVPSRPCTCTAACP